MSERRSPQLHKWSGAEYDRLVDLGIFDGKHIELINGEVVEMSPMNEAHARAIRLANYVLARVFPSDRFTVQVQCPLRLGEISRPEPDLSVIEGSALTLHAHPTSALLIIEVSQTTLEFDRKDKASLYARHNVHEYWIVNLIDQHIEVHRHPVIDTGEARYGEVRAYTPRDTITPLSAPDASIRVSDLLP